MKHCYKDIEYDLSRSERKTASIYIERDGSVSVQVPRQLRKPEVEEIIESRRYWIYRGLAEWEDLNASRVDREYVSGEGFLYLGSAYQLQIVPEQDVPLILRDGRFRLRCNGRVHNRAEIDEIFKGFYRDKGMQKIPERVAYYAPRMGVEPGQVRVRELGNRWASCSANGDLNFHWKAMMAPLTVLDYIVVHELAHLIHKNHTEAFWHEVDKVLPDYLSRKQWLGRNGAGMGL